MCAKEGVGDGAEYLPRALCVRGVGGSPEQRSRAEKSMNVGMEMARSSGPPGHESSQSEACGFGVGVVAKGSEHRELRASHRPPPTARTLSFSCVK